MRGRAILFIILLLTLSLWGQDTTKSITVIGNELTGRVENGESVREVSGNVILTQGNVIITCDRAIQYLARNDAKLIGNVVVTQDTLTIETPEGFYFGNIRKAFSDKGVKLNDSKVILTANTGEYLFNENKADFRERVRLYDTVSTMTADRLIYYRFLDQATAYGRVKITDKSNSINADSLTHFRIKQETYGYGDVVIENKENGTKIFGNYIEDYRLQDFSIIDKNPRLIQIDTVYGGGRDSVVFSEEDSTVIKERIALAPDTLQSIDTLIIKAEVMEAFRDTVNLFIARDSVEIIRKNFSSRNDQTLYFRNEEKIITNKMGEKNNPPVMWYDYTQLSGDSLSIYLKGNRINRVLVRTNALIVSQNELALTRYDQISGRDINMHFREGEISKVEVFENVLSLYNMYEENKPNGLIKASSKEAIIEFESRKVSTVRLYGEPKSDYYPENLIKGKEKEFVLPKFKIYEDKPVKEKLLETIRK
ncbi:MAG: LPS export ABC transporter periplasmic protein LptC [Ignavibacteriales bacterium]|nr:LPS export ABC transporter periplasmic protein LptC [Ignavibacteriales bacterium]HOJ19292.1 OstA-like protein [Ignavibacteriaceae bacterium]